MKENIDYERDFDSHIKVISQQLERIDINSYRNGYLQGMLDIYINLKNGNTEIPWGSANLPWQ